MKIFAKTKEIPDNGYQREIFEVEVNENVYARVMCCLIPEKPYFYLMEEENGATLIDGSGSSLGTAENEDKIIDFVRSWVKERQKLVQEVKTLYRVELGFMGEPQGVGLFQGLDDTPLPFNQKEEFNEAVKGLAVPLGVESPDGSDIVFFFTDKGLKTISCALNAVNQELNDVDWQMLGMRLELGEESCGLTLLDAIYVDEYQVAFSHSDLVEAIHRYVYQEVSAIDTDRDNPLVVLED